MIAARIHRFGRPDAIVIDHLPRPAPNAVEILVRTTAAGVGPWGALIREGTTALVPPLILGSEFAGVVDAVGPGVSEFKVGDDVYGATNRGFYGAYAEYVLAFTKLVARNLKTLGALLGPVATDTGINAASAARITASSRSSPASAASTISSRSPTMFGGRDATPVPAFFQMAVRVSPGSSTCTRTPLPATSRCNLKLRLSR